MKNKLYSLILVLVIVSCGSKNQGSGLTTVNLNPQNVKSLTNLGMVWGFLKYYHPEIAKGKYNWDAELFKVLPKILNASSNDEVYQLIEEWILDLGPVTPCQNCDSIPVKEIKLQPDYAYLFSENNLPASLKEKLNSIKENYYAFNDHHYINFTPHTGNPIFKNELTYSNSPYPDVGQRLLALYRFWNIIQYFYPYRHLIDGDWNKVLEEFIPKFINAKNEQEYTLVTLELIGRINDSHAYIWNNKTLESIKGNFMIPLIAEFVENKLLVKGYYQDLTGELEKQIPVGSSIEQIDGIPVDTLISRYLPLTPASNYITQLRDLSGKNGFLLRSNKTKASLFIKNGNEENEILIDRIPVTMLPSKSYSLPDGTGFKMLDNNIGYILPRNLKEGDISIIIDSFSQTRGLIIDLRCYPSTFMPFSYGAWIKNYSSPFATITKTTLKKPGSILYADTVPNGKRNNNNYNGKVVIIVNSETQSQAEFTAMALSGSSNVKVIGSTTAGADGDVSEIVLPGGIKTSISGVGIYYPDGTETQRVGIKIDIQIQPTINGIIKGKDELLEKAIEIIIS